MKLTILRLLLFTGKLFIIILGVADNIYAQNSNNSKLVSEDALNSRIEMVQYIKKAEKLPYSAPQKAISYANKVISYAQKYGDMELLANAQLINGYAYVNYGDFVTGFEYVLDAMNNCPPNNKPLKGKIIIKLSSLYIYLRDLNRAFEYANKALDISNELKDSSMIANCYNAIGLINIYIPDDELAEQNFLKALDINRKIGNKRGIVRNLNNLALYKSSNPVKKIEQLYEAISINKETDENWSLAENYNNLGMQYYYSGNYKKAIDALMYAKIYAQKVNAKELILDNSRYLATIYEADGNFKSAYSNLKNVLIEIEKEKMVEQIRIYETDLLQKRLDNTKNTIKIRAQEYKITTMKYIIFIVVLIFFAILLIATYFAYRYRQKREIQFLNDKNEIELHRREVRELMYKEKEIQANTAEKELEYIRNELTNTAFFVRTRGEMLANIQTQIKESYKLSDSDRLSKLYEISSDISQFNAKNNEMEILVDKVSSDFVFKLSQKYPKLTQNEQRLASLLRIGLSTKEIATITSAQPKTVDMARYRLRKKMELDSEESLHYCLSKL